MADGIIGILDSDYNYAGNFIHCLSSRSRLTFEFRLFSGRDALFSGGASSEIRLLFISEDYDHDADILSLSASVPVIILRGDDAEKKASDIPEIFKYRSPEAILREALSLYMNVGPGGRDSPGVYGITDRLNYRRPAITGIYSPLGSCCKTSFAIACSMYLANRPETSSVLLLSFDVFPGLGLFSDTDCDGPDMGDLIFYHNNMLSFGGGISDDFAARFNSIVRTRCGVSYVVPAGYENDIRSLDAKTFSSIIESVSLHTAYSHIIIDFGTKLPDIVPLLEIPSIVYMPVPGDFISSRKISSFLYTLDNINDEHPKTGTAHKSGNINLCAVKLPAGFMPVCSDTCNTYCDSVRKSDLFALAASYMKGEPFNAGSSTTTDSI